MPIHEYVAVSGFGAADACAPCYEAKSEQYQACRSLPAGSAQRETCFRAADADLGKCLDACGGSGKKMSTATLMLIGAGIAVLALS